MIKYRSNDEGVERIGALRVSYVQYYCLSEILTSREQLSVILVRERKFFQLKELFRLITALLQLLSMGSAKEYINQDYYILDIICSPFIFIIFIHRRYKYGK